MKTRTRLATLCVVLAALPLGAIAAEFKKTMPAK